MFFPINLKNILVNKEKNDKTFIKSFINQNLPSKKIKTA